MKLYQIALRNIKRNKRRSLLSGIAIAIAVMTIVFMFSMITGFLGDYQDNVFRYITGHLRVRDVEYSENEDLMPIHLSLRNVSALEETLSGVDNVADVVPRIQVGTMIYGSPRIMINDLTDVEGFYSHLARANDPLSAYIYEHLSGALKDRYASDGFGESTWIRFLDELFVLMQSSDFSQAVDLSAYSLPGGLTERKETGGTNELANRMLMNGVYPSFLKPSERQGTTYPSLAMGVDFAKEDKYLNLKKNLVDGRLPEEGPGRKEIVLAAGLAREMNVDIGDKISILSKTGETPDSTTFYTFRVVGIVLFEVGMFNKQLYFMPLSLAQKFTRLYDRATDLLVYTDDISGLKKTVAAVSAAAEKGGFKNLEILPWTKIGIYWELITYANMAYMFMAMFFFILGTTVIINTTMMVIYERMREIGTIAAMGMTRREIVMLFFLEACFISMIAAFAGVIIGLVITIPTTIWGLPFGEMVKDLEFEMSNTIYPVINWKSTVFVFFYAVVIASLCSMIPSRKAATVEPVEALRYI